MRNSIIAIVLAALAGHAAAGWTAIVTSSTATSYVDKDTIRRSGNTVKVWMLVDYAQPRLHGGKSYSSTISLEQYDCEDQQRRRLQLTLYQGQMRQGGVVDSFAPSSGWSYIEPGTIDELVLKIACAKK